MLSRVRRAPHPPGRPTQHARVWPRAHRWRPSRGRKRQPRAFVLGERETRLLVPAATAATTTLLGHSIVVPVSIDSLPVPRPAPPPLRVRFSAAAHIPRKIPIRTPPPAGRQVRALLRRGIVSGREQLRFPNPGPHLARQGAVRVHRRQRHPKHRGERSGRARERIHRKVRPRPVRIPCQSPDAEATARARPLVGRHREQSATKRTAEMPPA